MKSTRLRVALLLVPVLVLAACGSSAGVSEHEAFDGAAGMPDGPFMTAEGGAGPDGGGLVDGSPGGETGDGAHHAVDASSHGDASDAGDAGQGPYGSQGPDPVMTTTLSVAGSSGTYTTDVYYPGSGSSWPVVVLSSGLEQPALAYAPYAERLASWGIVTLLRDDPGISASTSGIVTDVSNMVTTELAAFDADSSNPLHGKLDLSRIGLAGHSRGGQVSLLAAEGAAKGHVKGVFGLDPVDGTSAPEAITSIASIGVPLAFIGETTDSASTSCAPSAQNYLALYAAASSPIVAITAVGADHTMFEVPAECMFCFLCTAGTANQATVIAYAERYLMAFFARVLQGDASVGATFSGAGAPADMAAGLITLESK